VEIRVQGSELEPETEFLIDYKVLKTELNAVLKSLDHKNLNEVPPFDTLNPSSENLSRHVYHELAPRLPARVRLVSVTVGEKKGQSATYFPG
jgi:6-pyruvoyltetrahydropterin/6-carboxytetrahydropterin synthase